MASWLTSPWLFHFLNLTILTILTILIDFLISHFCSQRKPQQQNQLAQAPSLFDRVRSFNQPNTAPLREFLQLDHANPDHPPTQLARSPSLLDINLSSLYRSDSSVPKMGSPTLSQLSPVTSSLATSSMAFQGSSSSSTHPCAYDVFLSFKGKDTRNNFTAHLHYALDRKGVNTFIDNNLTRGKSILPTLLNAIENSKISVIVLSKTYASSAWCLDELTKILECKEANGQIVLPIFYKIDPSEIRHQTKSVGEAFAKLEARIKNDTKVQRWKTILAQIANLSGWHLENGNESQHIHTIVEAISSLVRRPLLAIPHYPIGIESCVREVKLLLNLEMKTTLMIGIFGMGGIGKSTVAKVIYNSIASQFQGSCFLAIIRETSKQSGGLVKLQEMLLSNILGDSSLKVDSVDQGSNLIKQRLSSKTVFLILDDVDQPFQLQSLCGGCDWFGSGSRIIITTRNTHLLTTHGIDLTYKVKELDHNEAIQLFSWHAFKRDKPYYDYVELTEDAIRYAGGLPLALEVLGLSLYGRSVTEWRSALDRYKTIPNETIQKNLEISYDELNDTEKNIFLDIACFFRGERVDYVIEILRGCDFFPNIGIKVLKDKSLITIDEHNKLMMHDLFQEMGKEIVRRESKDPGRRSRVWFHDEARRVLEENMGRREVEGILVDLPEQDLIRLSSKAFKKMKRLRLFINRNARFFGMPDSLPNELRLIDWHEYPSQSLPSNFQGKKVVVFEMRNTLFKKVDELKSFHNMTILKFSNCKSLTKIPDLSTSPNLKELIVDECKKLVEVHYSVGFLDNLVSLTISRCSKLKSLPRILELGSLEVLVLQGCSMLQNFPAIGCGMRRLRSIDLRHTAVRELPSSMEYLIGLQELRIQGCSRLKNIPSSIRHLVVPRRRRHNCTAHLHYALDRKGVKIITLQEERTFHQHFLMLLKSQRFQLLYSLKTYASSAWCLDELTKILECKEANGQIVLPIFYKIDLSEVRHQTKSVGEAFAKLEARIKNDTKVQRWKTILAQIANLSGWHLENGISTKYRRGECRGASHWKDFQKYQKDLNPIHVTCQGLFGLTCPDAINCSRIWRMT